MLEEKDKLTPKIDIAENLESHNSKTRKVLNWLGIFFIIFGLIIVPWILASLIGISTGYGFASFVGAIIVFVPGFIALGITLVLIGKLISKKLTLWKKRIAIILIILLSPFALQATVGNITSFILTKFYLANHTIVSSYEGYKIPKERAVEVIRKAVDSKDANECKNLFPFPFNYIRPTTPLFWFFPFIGWVGDYDFMKTIYNNYGVSWLTPCVSAVAREKEDPKVCNDFPSYEYPSSYQMDKDLCLFENSLFLLNKYRDPKYCEYLKGVEGSIIGCGGLGRCITQAVKISQNYELCEKIKTDSICIGKDWEYNNCLFSIIPGLSQDLNWLIYKNQYYGYEFIHPKNWYFREFDNMPEFPEKACVLNGGTKCATWEELLFYSIPEDPMRSSVSIPTDLNLVSLYKNSWPDSCKVSLENPPDFLPKYYGWNEPKLVKTEVEPIKDSNHYFEKFYYIPNKKKGEGVGMEQNLLVARWCADNSSKLGAMMFYYNDESDEDFKIFNQMLSTFRFTD